MKHHKCKHRIIYKISMYLFTVLISSCSLMLIVGSLTTEFCQWESFTANCSHSSVIVMMQADYGRMKLGKCAQEEHGHIGCRTDILHYIDMLCSGKTHCEIPVSNVVAAGIHPCPVTVMSYLTTSYKCVTVVPRFGHKCITGNPIVVSGKSKYLSSYNAVDNSLGSNRCPWRIQVKPGQRLNFTMLDFGLWTSLKNRASIAAQPCAVSIRLQETITGQETTLCGGDERISNPYVSRTNIVDVSFAKTSRDNVERELLLKYEGCEELLHQSGQHISISDGVATITCDTTDAVQEMRCVDDEWEGEMMECDSDTDIVMEHSDDVLSNILGKGINPKGLLVILSVGILVGALTGVVCIMCIFVCMHRTGHELPCGLSPGPKSASRGSKLPHKSHFDYQYSTAVNPHIPHHGTLRQSNTVKRNEHVFIDPRTGLMYNTNSIKRSDVSGIRDIHNDCYQHASVASATHIYDCPNYDVQSAQDDDDYVQETHTDSTNTMDRNTGDKSLL